MNAETTTVNRYGVGALFLIAAVLVYAAPMYWMRVELHDLDPAEAYENSDLYERVYPAAQYGFTRLAAGDLPLWNPRQFCGIPFQADPRTGLFQPLNLVFLIVPIEQALALHAFLSLFLMGFFFVLFARSLDLRYTSALIGAVAYAFCGASAAAMSRPATAGALVWVPMLFWAMREHARESRTGWALTAGAAGGLLLLSGAYCLAGAMLLVFIPYRLLLAATPGPSNRAPFVQRLRGLFVMGAIALMLSAVQWLPTLAWALELESPLGFLGGIEYAGVAPVKAGDLLAQLFMAQPGSLPRLGYVGAVSLVLLPAALFYRARWRETVCFLVVGSVLLVGAFAGKGVLAAGGPRVSLLYAAMFCLTVLVTLGADRVLAPRVDYRSASVWLPALFVLATMVCVFLVSNSQGRGILLAFAALFVPSVLLRQRWATVICGVGTAFLLFLDLNVAANSAFRHPFEDAPECYSRYSASLEAAREHALDARAVVSARELDFGLPANLGMVFPVDVVGGAALPLTEGQAELWRRLSGGVEAEELPMYLTASADAAQPSLLNFTAARVLLAAPEGGLYKGEWKGEGPRLRTMQSGGEARLFLNEDALPRAYWVPGWRAADGVAEAFDEMASPSFNANRECVVDAADAELLEEAAPPPAAVPAPVDGTIAQYVPAVHEENAHPAPVLAAAAPGSEAPPAGEAMDLTLDAAPCSFEEVSPERLRIRVEAPAPGITILSDTFMSGWHATVDARPCPILRVNGVFRGIATPAGRHDIEFVYRPMSFVAGVALSLLGIMVAVVVILTGFFTIHVRPRRRA